CRLCKINMREGGPSLQQTTSFRLSSSTRHRLSTPTPLSDWLPTSGERFGTGFHAVFRIGTIAQGSIGFPRLTAFSVHMDAMWFRTHLSQP
ncbi:hypothetical protein GBF38_021961, partial [Nibea albiflora]